MGISIAPLVACATGFGLQASGFGLFNSYDASRDPTNGSQDSGS
jgi:hypothetical protein